MLDRLEVLYRDQPTVEGPDLLPVGTGLAELDRVCGGGAHRGWVTAVEADEPAQARALVSRVARHAEVPTLLDTGDAAGATTWLVAGASGIPATLLEHGTLSARDWEAIAEGVGVVSDRPLALSSATTLRSLQHLVLESGAELAVVLGPRRFGPAHEVYAGLGELARATGVAVLTAEGEASAAEVPHWALERVTRVEMVAHGLGGRAALVRVDDADTMAGAQVQVDCLAPDVR